MYTDKLALNHIRGYNLNEKKGKPFLVPPYTYLLTPWCRVLPEQLTGLQLVNKFPAFHGTRRFITALTGVRHLSLSWASPINSIYLHLTSWRSILILHIHLGLGLPIGLFRSGFPIHPPLLTYTRHMASPSHYHTLTNMICVTCYIQHFLKISSS